MADTVGTVTALDGEYAIVMVAETGCGRCHDQGGCGGNNLGKMFCSAPRTFRVLNHGKAGIGDRVNIAIADGAVRRSAALAYGFPLLALLVGAVGGSVLAGEPGAILGAISALIVAWWFLRTATRRGVDDQRFQPYIRD